MALVWVDVGARPVDTGLLLKRKFRPRCCAKTRAGVPVHHEGAARKAALSVSRRNVHRAQDEAWSRPDRRSTATALVFGHANIGLCHDFGVRPPAHIPGVCSMTTIVRCPRTGRACRAVTCRERHWGRQMLNAAYRTQGCL